MSGEIRSLISRAQAQQFGTLPAGETLYYREGTPLESIVEALRAYPESTTLEQLSAAAWDDKLEALLDDRRPGSQEIAHDINLDEDLAGISEELPANEDLLNEDNDAPVIRLINAILGEAIKARASDIHIEPFENQLSVRLRIDGGLAQVLTLSRKLAPLVLSRIKVMARLDIAEKRLPQDGRITLALGKRSIDVRVSTLPAQHGERAVLRLLDKTSLRLGLENLGVSAADRLRLGHIIHQPHGIILVTGPTGSGKSTTLYAMLSELNTPERNILTVEDPVEYDLPGIGQTQVNTRVEMSFARGLRAILRQDPDVVMVGEIRDTETAQIAVQASLTGHLVLSTLHTNSACGAITRLQDMGIAPFLLASSLVGVIAQRLVRRLCPACRQPVELLPGQQELFTQAGLSPTEIWQPVGCPACRHTGYQGRVAIHEVMAIEATLRRAIHEQASEMALEALCRPYGKTLLANGLEKVAAGETALEEVLRVTAQAQENGAVND